MSKSETLGCLGIILFFIILMCFCAYLGDRECSIRSDLLGVNEYKYNFLSLVSCRVKIDGYWIPVENYFIQGEQ